MSNHFSNWKPLWDSLPFYPSAGDYCAGRKEKLHYCVVNDIKHSKDYRGKNIENHITKRNTSMTFFFWIYWLIKIHGQSVKTVQTSTGFKYWLTKSSMISSVYSWIMTSQLARVGGSFWKSNPQMGFRVSLTAFSLFGSVIKLSIAPTKISQAVQDRSFLADWKMQWHHHQRKSQKKKQ